MRKVQIILSIAIVTVVLGMVVTAGTLRRYASSAKSDEVAMAEPDSTEAVASRHMAGVETPRADDVQVAREVEHADDSSFAAEAPASRASASVESNARGMNHVSSSDEGRESVFPSASGNHEFRHNSEGSGNDSGGRTIGGATPGISGTSVGGGVAAGAATGGGVSTGHVGTSAAPAPVPEPGSMMLFGSGLLVVGGMLRRRRAAKK